MVEAGRARAVRSSQPSGQSQRLGDNCMVETVFIFMITLKHASNRCVFFFLPALTRLLINSTSCRGLARSKSVRHNYYCLQNTHVSQLFLINHEINTHKSIVEYIYIVEEKEVCRLFTSVKGNHIGL